MADASGLPAGKATVQRSTSNFPRHKNGRLLRLKSKNPDFRRSQGFYVKNDIVFGYCFMNLETVVALLETTRIWYKPFGRLSTFTAVFSPALICRFFTVRPVTSVIAKLILPTTPFTFTFSTLAVGFG